MRSWSVHAASALRMRLGAPLLALFETLALARGHQGVHPLAGSFADVADLVALLLVGEGRIAANALNLGAGTLLEAAALGENVLGNAHFLPARLLFLLVLRLTLRL
jgi:NhaP-type Na+/H+ and K+/H+ antiporter